MALPAAPARLTPETFFAWEAEQPVRHEFYYGEVFAMAGGQPVHALLAARVIGQLHGRLRDGCHAFSSDLAVELDAAGHFCYPDVTVVCGEMQLSRHGPAAVNPALVVEVLSPSTAAWDLGGKADAYRHLPSLHEIVFVATDRPHAHTLRRDGDHWVVVDPEASRLPLDSVGAVLDLAALFDGAPLDAPARPST